MRIAIAGGDGLKNLDREQAKIMPECGVQQRSPVESLDLICAD
jgi:hypothetical protein